VAALAARLVKPHCHPAGRAQSLDSPDELARLIELIVDFEG
jgi:hypothetical protein